MRHPVLFLAAAALIVVAPLRSVAQVGQSRGSTHAGRLVGTGAELPAQGEGFHWQTNRRNPDARFGTPALVAAIVRAAGEVARVHAGGDVMINDISRPGGGPIRGHASHRSGRDADIGYYAVDASTGAAVTLARPLAFGPGGEGRVRTPEGRAVRIDVARTWAFMAALLGDRGITVQRLFIYSPLRALLLAHARATRADAALVARAAEALRPPHRAGAALHDDHFHLRIACGPADASAGCTD